jgi:DNA excision repair protein ERCC-3
MQRTVRLTLRGQTQAERQIGEEADEAYEADENAPGAEADADAEGDADAEAEAEAEGTHERTSWLQTPTASDSSALPLKADHGNRPLWVCSDGRVVLETFSPAYLPAYDFLITIAEPLSRPEHVHEYKLTPHSLYAAVSVGLLTETILTVLDRLSKTSLPHSLASYVRSCTLNYGKVKLVLQQNQFRVESEQLSVLRYLLSDPVISDAAVDSGTITTGGFVPKEVAAVELAAQATEAAKGKHFDAGDANYWKAKANVKDEPTAPAQDPASASACDSTDQNINHNAANGAALLHAEFRNAGRQQEEHAQCVAAQQEQQQQQHVDRWQSNAEVHSFAVQGQKVEQVKKRCLPDGLNYPMLEEYDFRNDTTSPDLPFELKPGTKIRDYQQKCLNKMFGNGRARSGIIVLPCGAGKTLAGVAAAARVRKSVLVLCLDAVSVDQWKEQFKLWSTLPDERIKRFTRQKKEDFDQDAGVCLTTYHMVSIDKNRRSETARKYLERISSIDWGLIIMDEVHVAPASKFRKVIGIVKAHCKLGLTATLVREDERVNDLNFLIGPKLYEADWLSLQRQGYIAKVQCAEVWCPMTKEFFRYDSLYPILPSWLSLLSR